MTDYLNDHDGETNEAPVFEDIPSRFEMNLHNLSDDELRSAFEILLERIYERANKIADTHPIPGIGLQVTAKGRVGGGLELKYRVTLDSTYIAEADPHSAHGFDAPFEECLRRMGYQREHEKVRMIGGPVRLAAE